MNQIVKEFHFGTEGKEKLFKGIDTLAGAVASTLGAGGETVIFEDNAGVPVIIGEQGVEKIIELELDANEKTNFDQSIKSVQELFDAAKKIDSSL